MFPPDNAAPPMAAISGRLFYLGRLGVLILLHRMRKTLHPS